MRLWSLHPKYLDPKGLVALWREGLLAQKLLLGKTKGYRNHPQLKRFKKTANPLGAIATYLRFVFIESENRGYSFDKNKIINRRLQSTINVTDGQLEYEYRHLLKKLEQRDPEYLNQLSRIKKIETHPLFTKIHGNIESWEVV